MEVKNMSAITLDKEQEASIDEFVEHITGTQYTDKELVQSAAEHAPDADGFVMMVQILAMYKASLKLGIDPKVMIKEFFNQYGALSDVDIN